MIETIVLILIIILVVILLWYLIGGKIPFTDKHVSIERNGKIVVKEPQSFMDPGWNPEKTWKKEAKRRSKLTEDQVLKEKPDYAKYIKGTIDSILAKVDKSILTESPLRVIYMISDNYSLTYQLDDQLNLTYTRVVSGPIGMFIHVTCKLDALELYRNNLDSMDLNFMLTGIIDYHAEHKKGIGRFGYAAVDAWCEETKDQESYMLM